MGLHQTKKPVHSKGNHWENEKITYWTGESFCKWYIKYGVNIKNIWRSHTTQKLKNPKQPG